MSTFLRTIEFLGLSLWLGSDVFLSFVVAPGAFRILASRDQAGTMVGFALWWMHMIGVVCGIAILHTTPIMCIHHSANPTIVPAWSRLAKIRNAPGATTKLRNTSLPSHKLKP